MERNEWVRAEDLDWIMERHDSGDRTEAQTKQIQTEQSVTPPSVSVNPIHIFTVISST